MKEILENMKIKYLSFDKSKSKINFTLDKNVLNLSIIKNRKERMNKEINMDSININDYMASITTERNKSKIFFKNNNLKFDEMYNKSMKKIFKKKIKNKLPDLKNISNSRNLIIQKIRRNVLFTEEDYPYSLNDNEYGYKTLRFREKKDILKEKKCILEQIDNEEYMSKIKFFFKEEIINKEKIYFKEKDNYNIFNFLSKKINTFKYENNSCLTKEYFVKRDYKTYLAGRLSINSILIKISDAYTNQQKKFFLPFTLIPFYLSIPRNIFNYFISQILSTNKNLENNIFNEIIIDEKKIEKYIKIIVSNYKLFENNSILFEEKKLEKENFYLFINTKTYIITIIPPYIELSKNEKKIKIKKIASKGLWLTLFQKDYKNWDLITLIYLYSFHDFRQIQYSTIKFHSNEIINLNLDKKNSNIFEIPEIKEIDKSISFYIYDNGVINNENLFSFLTLYFYSIDQIYNKNKQYKLYFNMGQTKILLDSNNNNINLLPLLYKCSLENEEHKGINFNFPLIKTISIEKENNYFNYYNQKYNKKFSKSFYKCKYKKGLNIKLNLPYIEINEIDEYKILKKNYQIKEEILNKMLELDYVEMLKDIGYFFINNYNIDITSNNILKGENKNIKLKADKNIKRTQTQSNIKVKNNLIFKSTFLFNNKNKKASLLSRNSLDNKKFNI